MPDTTPNSVMAGTNDNDALVPPSSSSADSPSNSELSASASASSPGVVTRSMAAATTGADADADGSSENSPDRGSGPGTGRQGTAAPALASTRPPGPRRTSTVDTVAMAGAATAGSPGENSPREGGAISNNNGRNVRTIASPNNGAAEMETPTAATDRVPGGQRVPSIARRSVSSGSGGGENAGGFGHGDDDGMRPGPRRSPPGMAPTGVNVSTYTAPLAGSAGGGHSAVGASASTAASSASAGGSRCVNPASEINSRLDAHIEVKVYPCNNNASSTSQQQKKNKFTQFTIKPEGVIIQGANSRHRAAQSGSGDLGAEYAQHIGRKLRRYELSDTRACQLLVTTHGGSYWAVPAPEAFSRHSGTCRLLGDRKHPLASHTLQVGDFLRVGSVGVVVIETHDGTENKILSEDKIKKIIKDTTSGNGGFLDFGETEDGELVLLFPGSSSF